MSVAKGNVLALVLSDGVSLVLDLDAVPDEALRKIVSQSTRALEVRATVELTEAAGKRVDVHKMVNAPPRDFVPPTPKKRSKR